MKNQRLYDYIQEFPELSENEVEVKFIRDTIKEIGKVSVSLEEAEEIWGDHSLSLFANWLVISKNETMEGLFSEIIDKDVLDIVAKEQIFEILNKREKRNR